MNAELEKLILSAGDLPTIPVVATKVMQLIDSENATAEDLARIVSSDPAVAARVLKISNSAFYGCQRKIQTLSNAIVVLGFSTLKSLVVAASVKQVYQPYGLTEKMLWEHSFAAALAAKIIAGNIRIVNEEEAFLAGLFHDIGKTLMNNHDNNKFREVIQRCYNEGISFDEAEKAVYPFTHAEAGALVIRKWNFPQDLMNTVLRHHTLDFPDEHDIYHIRMTAVVHMANAMTLKLGIGSRMPDDSIELPSLKSAQILQIGPQRLQTLLETFEEAYERDRKYFE